MSVYLFDTCWYCIEMGEYVVDFSPAWDPETVGRFIGVIDL